MSQKEDLVAKVVNTFIPEAKVLGIQNEEVKELGYENMDRIYRMVQKRYKNVEHNFTAQELRSALTYLGKPRDEVVDKSPLLPLLRKDDYFDRDEWLVSYNPEKGFQDAKIVEKDKGMVSYKLVDSEDEPISEKITSPVDNPLIMKESDLWLLEKNPNPFAEYWAKCIEAEPGCNKETAYDFVKDLYKAALTEKEE